MNHVVGRNNSSLAAAASCVVLGGVTGSWWKYSEKPAAACDQSRMPSSSSSKLLFLGTGSSTGCPKPLCSMLYQEQNAHGNNNAAVVDAELLLNQKTFAKYCKTSRLAIQGDPRFNRDYRNNPSLLIQFQDDNHKTRNIVIDVGKTFREASLRWMPLNNIQSLDAVILTHHHMDAVGGLDDLRGFQRVQFDTFPQIGASTATNDHVLSSATPKRVPISVYLSQECLEQVASQFPWLFPNHQPPKAACTTTAAGTPAAASVVVVQRDVAALDVHVIEEYKPFICHGLTIVPLPVWHGEDLICLGYAFSLPASSSTTATNVILLSDISRMKQSTLKYIKERLPPTDIFICDTLLEKDIHPVHFNLQQATDLAREIGAKRTYLLGMNCDSFPSHDIMNERLMAAARKTATRTSKDASTIVFAHDGLVLTM